jgi:hypothetical protein
MTCIMGYKLYFLFYEVSITAMAHTRTRHHILDETQDMANIGFDPYLLWVTNSQLQLGRGQLGPPRPKNLGSGRAGLARWAVLALIFFSLNVEPSRSWAYTLHDLEGSCQPIRAKLLLLWPGLGPIYTIGLDITFYHCGFPGPTWSPTRLELCHAWGPTNHPKMIRENT